jgi:hypothetical protein
LNNYWELIKDKNDIKIFINKQNCKYACLRIEVLIDVNLDLYIEYINKADKYTDWIYACIESKELYRKGNVSISYTITDMPYPFYDRILTLEARQYFRKNYYESRSISIPSYNPDNKYVEIPHFRNKWIVREIAPSTIKIDYEVETEPGGIIPSWLYNLGVDIGPYNSMYALKTNLEELQKQATINQ